MQRTKGNCQRQKNTETPRPISEAPLWGRAQRLSRRRVEAKDEAAVLWRELMQQFESALVIGDDDWLNDLAKVIRGEAKPEPVAKPAPRSRTLIAALIIAVGLAAVAGLYIFSHRPTPIAPPSVSAPAPAAVVIPEKSIAVLPFENLSEDKANAYFADGIQDEILTRLSKIADLKVVSRTSTQQYQSKPGNLSEIAKQLGVAHIVEGSVQKSGESVRVNVQRCLVPGRSRSPPGWRRAWATPTAPSPLYRSYSRCRAMAHWRKTCRLLLRCSGSIRCSIRFGMIRASKSSAEE